MSDKMKPSEYRVLLRQMLKEAKEQGTCFYTPMIPIKDDKRLEFCGAKLESPIGPAAGPHTQLAQNILAAYVSGGRFFELKTVQILEGEALGIKKPCIYVKDEAYNIEWSTELTVEEALEEYVKAWFLVHLASKEFSVGRSDGFVFNMSVGYDLEGIQSKKIDAFMEGLKNASQLPIWKECKETSIEFLAEYEKVDQKFIEDISPVICNSITLSTMHGCPPEQIEQIAQYLLKEKHLHTYIKCNPTLLGEEKVSTILQQIGFGSLTFSSHHFEADLKKEEAVELIKRCQDTARKEGLEFGVKLTNTFPVDSNGESLEGDAMYLSGKPLFPLAIGVAQLLCEAFDGKLPMSFSGGVDTYNVAPLFEAGVYPITVATILLKQGGYKNLTKLEEAVFEKGLIEADKVSYDKLSSLSMNAATDSHYQPVKSKKIERKESKQSPLNCHICKNCVDVCPNRANIPMDTQDRKNTIHLDSLCNECGNCSCFCPLGFVPYLEKFTYFSSVDEWNDSNNNGFAWIDKEKQKIMLRVDQLIYEGAVQETNILAEEIKELIRMTADKDKAVSFN